jgi:hypothetical protein
MPGPASATLLLRENQPSFSSGLLTGPRRAEQTLLETVDMNSASGESGALPMTGTAAPSAAVAAQVAASHLACPASPQDPLPLSAPSLEEHGSPVAAVHVPNDAVTPAAAPLTAGSSPASGAVLSLRGSLEGLSAGSNTLVCRGDARLMSVMP